ncbi:putative short-chain dehydrogenase [Lineolata rhizophorae]|uniref:Putative short-chain dehydrogenase n=1 Tax=Lineolata rhizophorae TaxID=578093 RepID=A0A6A6NXN3_9PEZI|nr:putative short-chain dehydrogenase [Lineolata rhizophorae]
MADLFDLVRTQRTQLPIVPTPSTVAGGTYIVTGANTGLGFECAKHFISLGASRVIIAVRSVQKGDAALAIIRKETGRYDVGEVWELDLASLDSVEAFAKRLDTLDRVDALIENASLALVQFSLTEGMETSLMVNVASTMLLAIRALPKLRASAKMFKIQPHLVVVTSGTAFSQKGVLEGTEGNIFDALSAKGTTNIAERYPLTKLLQIYAVRQLASLFPVSDTNVVINAVNPGLCTTELARNAGFIFRLQLGLMKLLLGRTAEEGSRTLLHAAVAGVASHGKYVSDCRIKEDYIPEWIRDESGCLTQRRVWGDLVKTLETRGHTVDIPGHPANKV